MYAIVRNDLNMSPGKMAAQTGHAFLDTYDECRNKDPSRAAEYHDGCHGTKVVLGAKSLDQLMLIYEQAKAEGLPCTVITDSGHVMPPHFDGSPIVTAVGIGPVTRNESHHITKRLNVVR
jgi:peptidyl-tRNA hydrolase, PTH2 family